MSLQLPREPRTGDQIEASIVAQLIRYVKSITPRSTDTLRWEITSGGARGHAGGRGGKRGTAMVEQPSWLQPTLSYPPGYVLPPGEARTPIFISWGIAGNKIPSNIHEPLLWVNLATNGLIDPWYRYMGITLTLSKTKAGFVSSAVLSSEEDDSAYWEQEFAFDEDGSPPETVKIMLGMVTAHKGALTLNSTGNGSLVVYSYVSGLQTQAGATSIDALINFQLNLGWHRQVGS